MKCHLCAESTDPACLVVEKASFRGPAGDLIRRDMQDHAAATNIFEGLDDVRKGRFSSQSILDVHDED